MSEDCSELWLGDQLPTVYEAAITIFHFSPTSCSRKRTSYVNRYAVTLRNIWIRAFDEPHVISVNAICKRLVLVMKDYEAKVRWKHQSSSHHTTLRMRHRDWMEMDIAQPKRGKRLKQCKNSQLLDIGKDCEQLTGDERIFYLDQCSERKHLISQSVDEEYETDKRTRRDQELSREEHIASELSFIEAGASPEVIQITPTSSRRELPACGKSLLEVYPVDKACQADLNVAPEIRLVKKTTTNVKNAVATVSSQAGISVPKARVATQVVCKKLYGHDYSLSPPSVNDSTDPEKKGAPRSSADYEKYKNVLPSAKTVNNFKHKKALAQEIAAAHAVVKKSESTKITLHYDSTSRSRIDGEWPCLILNFLDPDPSKCQMISLRPLFFAFEDRQQITLLITETLRRLQFAIDGTVDHDRVVALWERIDAVMTDAVSKNLNVENSVADSLNSEHVPYHILCKSHTCERLDEDNLSTLAALEERLNLRDLILKREPLLKSFLRGSKSIVYCALVALLKLVSHEGDGKTTSLADQFDLILEDAGKNLSF